MSEDTNDTVQSTTPPQEKKEPGSITLILSLGIAGLLSGIVLASVYLFATPLIEANKEEALRKAIFKVLPGCQEYTTLELRDGLLVKVAEKEPGEEKSDEVVARVFAGFGADGELIGFAIQGSEPGFQDIITVLYGYEVAEQMIIGFEVLESKETPGLGDKIFKDADFTASFAALSVTPEIVAVKKGQKSADNELETITGATISSRAIIRLLNNSLAEWKAIMEDYHHNNPTGKAN